jgi:hypothetical protein
LATQVVITEAQSAPAAWPAADLHLQWEGPQRNAQRGEAGLRALLPSLPAPLAEDLLDLAASVYLTDIAVPRGRNEDWVRHLHLQVPVREPDFWQQAAEDLSHLLYVLTRDSFQFSFAPLTTASVGEVPVVAAGAGADCVSLLSGGIDSLAGAVLLLRTGRRPLFVSHQSGNPTIAASQSAVRGMLEKLAPGAFSGSGVRLTAGGRGASRLPFPPAAEREPSQRSRAFLFMSLGILGASGSGAHDVYAFENGILTIALPLAASRIGGLSTRSTHPRVMSLLTHLCRRADLGCQILNPFVYQTKAEIIRDVLRPALSLFEIQQTVSCWAAGRRSRQCGGCVACLVRRFSMLAAGLPDEAYERDLLSCPNDYLGTDAYTNLIDLLTQSAEFLRHTDEELVTQMPELLDLSGLGLSLTDVLDLYRRHAREVRQVATAHFPHVAALLDQAADA